MRLRESDPRSDQLFGACTTEMNSFAIRSREKRSRTRVWLRRPFLWRRGRSFTADSSADASAAGFSGFGSG